MRIGTDTPNEIHLHPQRTPLRLVLAAAALALLAFFALSPPVAQALVDPLAYQPELDDGPLGPGRQAYRERRDPARALESYELFKAVVADRPRSERLQLFHDNAARIYRIA